MVLHKDDGSTLDDLREAVNTLEDAGRIGRRVLGGAHPLKTCLLYTSPSPRDVEESRMPSSA